MIPQTMTDGFRIWYLPVYDIDQLTDKFNFESPVNVNTGEVMKNVKRLYYKGLFVYIKNENCSLRGSMPKYYNNGKDNSNNFTYYDIIKTIDSLSSEFNFDPFKARLNKIEFGVNIDLSYGIDLLLDSIIESYKYKPLDRYYDDNKIQIIGYECKMQKCRFKIYNKSEQLKLPGNILRIEISTEKMQFLGSKGIQLNTLGDLYNPNIYSKLKEPLINMLSNLMIFDKTMVGVKFESPYLYGKFWRNIKADKHKRDYHLKKFKKIAEETGANWMQKELIRLVSEKWDQLCDF